MLPLLRVLPVGGVFLAILILVLALIPPGELHHALSLTVVTERVPLLERDTHPQERQFLIRSALRRADELSRLRELPDTPVRDAPVAVPLEPEASPAPLDTASAAPDDAPPAAEPAFLPQQTPSVVAGLPSDRPTADPDRDDIITGSVSEAPGATIPIDIGETSSTELPVVRPDERPPIIRTPERLKGPRDSRHKHWRRIYHAKVQPKAQPPQPMNFFEALFGSHLDAPRPGPAVNYNFNAMQNTHAVRRQFSANGQ